MRILLLLAFISLVCGMPNLQDATKLISGKPMNNAAEGLGINDVWMMGSHPECKKHECRDASMYAVLIVDPPATTTTPKPGAVTTPKSGPTPKGCEASACNTECTKDKKWSLGDCAENATLKVTQCCCYAECSSDKIGTLGGLIILCAVAVYAIPSHLFKE